jgi:hypothetical protein
VSLYPAILDYYSFTSDHVTFVLGDTLALLGVLALDKVPYRRARVAAAVLCFVLCAAIYQPKIALIALLLLIWCIRGAITERNVRSLVTERIVPAAFVFVLSLVVYYVATKLVMVTATSVPRTHINDPQAILREALRAYPEVWRYFTRADYLPQLLHALPFLGIVLGSVALMWQVRTKGWFMLCAMLVLLAAFPLVLQLTYIINDMTWRNAGRILTAHAYFVLFFLVSAWALPRLRMASITVLGIMIYFFVIVGVQETSAAALKTVYDLQKLNRIVARMEPLLSPGGIPVVAIGSMRQSRVVERKRSYPNRLYRPNITKDTFAPYRQVAILNFFLGHDLLRVPTRGQVEAAVGSAKGREPWPSPDSVYLHDGVLVILLTEYKPGALTTWSQ